MQDGFTTLATRIGDFLHITQDGYAIFAEDDSLIGCNQAFADLMFIDFTTIIGLSFNDIIRTVHQNQKGPNIETDNIEQWLASANNNRRAREFRLFEVDLIDGRWFLMSEQVLPSGEILLQAKNITKQKVVERTLYEHTHQLSNLAATDELTQISNRRSFIAQVNSELNRCARNQLDVIFCLLDIDYFKKVNDTYGHVVGDKVLVQLAAEVKKLLREYDPFGRIGGEEFGILLPETSVEQAQEITERLCTVIKQKTFSNTETPVNISVSIGMTEAQPHSTFEQLYNQADQALYKAKEQGRNRVVEHSASIP